MRLRARKTPEETWMDDGYLILENVGDQHIILKLDTGALRFDIGRKIRFRPDVMDSPQVKSLIEAGQIKIGE